MRLSPKKLKEKIVEAILLVSGVMTSIVVLLIIIFLFKEGVGLFGRKAMEEGYVLAVNKTNPVKELSSNEIKRIFDQEITNWKEVGGKADSIILFRMDDIGNFYSDEELGENFEHLPAKIDELISKNPGMVAFLSEKYYTPKLQARKVEIEDIGFWSFLTGDEWFPTAHPAPQFGIFPLLMGTLWVSIGAILIALPLGLATAIYMAEIANERVRRILKPVIELLAGIPSVVYGFFGLIVIVPQIEKLFRLPVGETGLAGSIILGIMALPTIITISEDAIRNTPRAMKEASLALGATQWQTIYRIVIPYSASGITSGAILGIGRAIGETMAVLMVTGNAAVIPHTLLEPVRTIPATIAAELGEASQGGLHYQALFSLACILFVITMAINFSVEFISSRRRK